jgi:hypothetical protein
MRGGEGGEGGGGEGVDGEPTPQILVIGTILGTKA